MKTHTNKPASVAQPAQQVQCKNEPVNNESCLKSNPPALFQAKLSVGAPDDPFEQEADKISHQVMDSYDQVTNVQSKLSTLGLQTLIQPMSVATISRKLQKRILRAAYFLQSKCDQCEKEEKEHGLNKKSNRLQFDGDGAQVSAQTEARIESQRGSGQAMDPVTQTAMESSFGADFSSVRIHTDSSAVQLSRDLNAHAFTVGNDIFFNEGTYQPHTKGGAGLLAHELTHVVQQGAAVQNKSVNRLPHSSLFNHATLSKLSSMNGNAAQQARLYRKQIAQFQKEVPDGTMMKQQQQVLQTQKVDNVQTQSNAKVMRMYGGGGSSTPPATKRARLKSGPTYTPHGNVAPSPGGSGKQVSFNLRAEFDHDPANGIDKSCGEIRQDIQWDATMATSFASTNGVPHNGFPNKHPANTWIEDRSPGDTVRLGHRTGTYAVVQTWNRFEDSAGNLDMANGAIYKGNDKPSMLSTDKGVMQFRFYAIDVCNGNAQIGSTDTISITWG